ncbi:MAG: hypothetical protein DMD33_19580 [Gemmatimonadetes bacterium]|nr:MAG: hypothetical protein DMD33_19580 [Gemmatimonadota bacterium]
MRRVAVVDEEEIFRLGIVACLAQDPTFEIVFSGAAGPLTEEADVAVVSAQALARHAFECPVVVCANDSPTSIRAKRTVVAAVLPRATLTGEQLVAAVTATAAGLWVSSRGDLPEGIEEVQLDPRRREVLRLLAEGADTVTISEQLCYSVRTIKAFIQDIEHELSASSRAQAVARGIRRGII